MNPRKITTLAARFLIRTFRGMECITIRWDDEAGPNGHPAPREETQVYGGDDGSDRVPPDDSGGGAGEYLDASACVCPLNENSTGFGLSKTSTKRGRELAILMTKPRGKG